jgi:4-hydroxymandelate oxidase
MIGRPYLYALALGGAEGVEQVVRILHTELESAFALLGRASVRSVDRAVLW